MVRESRRAAEPRVGELIGQMKHVSEEMGERETVIDETKEGSRLLRSQAFQEEGAAGDGGESR